MANEFLGCPNCSASNLVASPDSSYVKAHSEYKSGAKEAKYKCLGCRMENIVYWTKN